MLKKLGRGSPVVAVWEIMMNKIYWIWTLLFLLVCTITDIRKRIIYGWFCVTNIIVVIVVHIVIGDNEIKSFISGIMLGMIFVMISLLTKEKLGYGDSMVLLSIGAILGGGKLFLIIFWSFLICSIFSVTAIICRKMSLKSSLAFVPFVLMGAIIVCIKYG